MTSSPDLLEAILGWRRWSIQNGMLHAPYLNTIWPVETKAAKCEPYPEASLDWDGTEVVLPNLWKEACLCGETHNILSFPTKEGCKPRAYPKSVAEMESLARPVQAEGKVVKYSEWHISPQIDCACGWYALHNPPQDCFFKKQSLFVWGAVIGFGKTVVTPTGFRSQYAKPIGLIGDYHLLPIAYRYDLEIYNTPQQLQNSVEYKPLPPSMYPQP